MSSLIAREHKRRLRVAVAVPCSHKHAGHLAELCQELGQQSRKPDEVVIALSGCEAPKLPPNVRVVHSGSPCTTGKNRNRAVDASTADVIIFQDADDLIHPQRVEIVAALFEGYEVEHLMHGYVYTKGTRWSVGFPNASNQKDLPIVLPPYKLKDAIEKSRYGTQPAHSSQVTNGHACLLRSVYGTVRWSERGGTGTDVEFNRLVYGKFKRTVTTPLPLVVYRHNLSSFR